MRAKTSTYVAPATAISSGFALVNTASVVIKQPTPRTIVTTRAVTLVRTRHRTAGTRIIRIVSEAITERAIREINGCSKMNTLGSFETSP